MEKATVIHMSHSAEIQIYPRSNAIIVLHTVEEIAEQLDISKKVAYSLVKSGQFSYVRAGKAIRVSKVSFDKWLNEI